MVNRDEIPVSVNTPLGLGGGTSRHEKVVDYETAMFMLQADFVEFDNQLYKVKNSVVVPGGFIDFYCDEVEREDLF